jgi:hypothetical protein
MRGVIRFLFAEGVKPLEIIRRFQAQYSVNSLSHSKIYFKNRRTSVCDEERPGRPSTSRTESKFKSLKEWYGKADESQWTTLRRLPYIWTNERSSKRKKVFIRLRRSHWRSAKLVKDATKKLSFMTELKKTCETL